MIEGNVAELGRVDRRELRGQTQSARWRTKVRAGRNDLAPAFPPHSAQLGAGARIASSSSHDGSTNLNRDRRLKDHNMPSGMSARKSLLTSAEHDRGGLK
jgi:hypothetical protein